MATSTIPATIDALIEILQGAAGLSEVVVHDGEPATDLEDGEYVAVGWQPGGEAAVEMTQDFAHIGARQRDEHFDILCSLRAWTGDTDMSARRLRAFELLAAVEDALRATDAAPEAPSLNGTVMWAHLTQASLLPDRSPDGVDVDVLFRISCRSRI
jgi:hypothetical protein